jgi:hypothetical protein
MLVRPLPLRSRVDGGADAADAAADLIDSATHRGSRRRSERVPMHADVEIFEPSAATGVVLNASTGGLRIAVDRPLYVNDVCALRITLGSDDSTITRARVVWVREMKDGFLAGLELIRH